MKPEKPLVEIKGVGGMLGLLIDEAGAFDQIEEELTELLQRPHSKNFFQGAEIFLQSHRPLSAEEFARLENLLRGEGALHLKTQPEETPAEAALLPPNLSAEPTPPEDSTTLPLLDAASSEAFASIPIDPPATNLERPHGLEQVHEMLDAALGKGLKATDALLVRQTLHSGQNVRSKSSVILFGDLNAGGEIASDEDIIVLGTLRGMVHAGVSGNRKALIFALRMQPTQIRIAELIAQPPQEALPKHQQEPEIAFIEGDKVIMERCVKIRV